MMETTPSSAAFGRLLRAALLVAVVAPVTLASGEALAACGARLQTGPNQNPVALAQRCGTTYQNLRRANPSLNLKHGLNGQIINVPQKPKPLIDPKINGGLPPAGSTRPPHSHVPIRPSSMLETPARAQGGSYVVRAGDTLSAIADRNGLSLRSVMGANPGVDPRALRVGQRLSLPAVD